MVKLHSTTWLGKAGQHCTLGWHSLRIQNSTKRTRQIWHMKSQQGQCLSQFIKKCQLGINSFAKFLNSVEVISLTRWQINYFLLFISLHNEKGSMEPYFGSKKNLGLPCRKKYLYTQYLSKTGIETYIHSEVLQSLKFIKVFLQFGVNSWSLVLRVF